MTPTVVSVLGTYNRLALLQSCVSSLRDAVPALHHRILVADGGSTDYSREWLAAQPDCELLEGGMAGAVRAYNVAFARAVDLAPAYVNIVNDDDAVVGLGAITRAVERMDAEPHLGALVWESDLRGGWKCEGWGGQVYPNKGLVRLEAGMSAARAQGDPEGKAWWNPDYHTYGADGEMGMWLVRLGWKVEPATGLRVHDVRSEAVNLAPMDDLQRRNKAEYGETGKLFLRRWGKPASFAYSREDAERFGGVLR